MKVLLFPALLTVAILTAPPKGTHWTGTANIGQQENKINFEVSADGKHLSSLTFDGFWNCSGKQAKRTIGPQEIFEIQDGKVQGVVQDASSGGLLRFVLQGDFVGKAVRQKEFRMNLSASPCETYTVQWVAAPAE
ncbi:hypothetical protein HMJ29_08400 [Hymenobacter taeanensis]|uniref:Uncharacterized protein n=1 Tax=Hymenobacter taeanensis TaxID=2735321 RepID=A0A6M6BEF9_9BACT|nr:MULTISPECIES: hypothetical protein [Hymenobacter]QJX46951.1 hypothetical protein HMJ29_08400 [Hymenobacter taeanensis]UOQ80830.1 hypothetical protein MUN83_18765 [Hymenobacter sp. 5414T-23]